MHYIATKILSSPFEGGLGMLEPDPKDARDLRTDLFGVDSYSPQHERKIIQTLSFKDQTGRNTCTYETAVLLKEQDEKEILSVRSVVIYAFQQGFITSNGFSSLKNSQKAIQKYGATPQFLIPDYHGAWRNYLNAPALTPTNIEIANLRRSETYWRADTISEIYRKLDEGKLVQVALRWYSGYNQGGGFRSPFILRFKSGYKVGNHATAIIGYDQNYKGRNVFIFQNSFGGKWGDGGKFYMDVEYFADELDLFGGFIQEDITRTVGEFIRDYTGKPVKGPSNPATYLIQNGQARWFPNEQIFLQKGFHFQEIEVVDETLLNQIPQGEPIYS